MWIRQQAMISSLKTAKDSFKRNKTMDVTGNDQKAHASCENKIKKGASMCARTAQGVGNKRVDVDLTTSDYIGGQRRK